ncbi:hypothetical protein [Kribbella sp. CA-293567]|uniref:hypothetical protein n=1 Tax=Kribbella sp. CA-293567 TaxID=3002436 RepID=UPI0022DE7E83|nr:hypothetical protein [Kribbella sp. CA-293567]WBQ01869.1 hypothetical protein OX958_17930 [Kribbella sp. CA-293567]
MPDDLLRPTIGADVDMTTRPWRLMSQAYVAFFGGVIATTVVALFNARRLGVPAQGQRLIALSGLGGLVLAAIAMVMLTDELTASSGTRLAIRIIAVLACLAQMRIQQPMDRAFQLRGSEYRSLWGPGIAAVIGCGLLEIGLLALVVTAV